MKFNQNKKKRFKNKKFLNFVTFFVALVVFIVVLGLIVLWAYIKLENEERPASSEQISSSDLFSDADQCKNLFLTIVDGEKLNSIMLIRSDPVKKSILVTSVPTEMTVDAGLEEKTLYSIYTDMQTAGLSETFSAVAGIKIDNWAELSIGNIRDVLKYYGKPIEYDLSENLEYKDDGLNIKMQQGMQSLSTSQVIDIIRYPAAAWSEGEATRYKATEKLFEAFINQILVQSRAENFEKDFGSLIDIFKSNMRIAHFYEAKEGLEYLASINKGTLTTVVTATGEYAGEASARRFYLSEASEKELAEKFK